MEKKETSFNILQPNDYLCFGNVRYYVAQKSSIWKSCKKLVCADNNTKKCLTCGRPLKESKTYIPIGNNKTVIVHGMLCHNCNCLFVRNGKAIFKMLKDNTFAKDFTLDGLSLWNCSELVRQVLDHREEVSLQKSLKEIPSAALLVLAQDSDNRQHRFIIVNSKKDANGETCLHYSHKFARELLTALYIESRCKTAYYNEKVFHVSKAISPEVSQNSTNSVFLPQELFFKTGGGYYSYQKDRNSEIIDILLYSPFSGRYECVHATHDKHFDEYYMDASIFRRFIHEYGNPGIKIASSCNGSYSRDWNDLQAESILKGYGYSVSQNDRLSPVERQDILAELVDLNILTIPYIVRMLEFFISSHSGEKYLYARMKWEDDKKYISNYRANPSRFLIAKVGQGTH